MAEPARRQRAASLPNRCAQLVVRSMISPSCPASATQGLNFPAQRLSAARNDAFAAWLQPFCQIRRV